MSLFRTGEFTLHSGRPSDFKIDCDALTDQDWQAVAHVLARMLPPFSDVEGVPTGGLKLARCLRHFVAGCGPVLIVDDVLTTGASMEAHRAGRHAVGAVAFARGDCPEWVTPLFACNERRFR